MCCSCNSQEVTDHGVGTISFVRVAGTILAVGEIRFLSHSSWDWTKFFGLLIGFSFCGLGVWLIVVDSRAGLRRRSQPRGFEVKLDTGQTPVLQKKEVDHG
jgi:hypothetical protein